MGHRTSTFERFEADLGKFDLSPGERQGLVEWAKGMPKEWVKLDGKPRFIQLVFDDANIKKLTSVGWEESRKGEFVQVWAPTAVQGPPATFDETWQSQDWMQWYMTFAGESYTTENPYFIFDVLEYRDNPTPEEYARIVNTYVADQAPQQINISSVMRNKIMSMEIVVMATDESSTFVPGFEPSDADKDPNVEELSQVFDEASAEVMKLMRDGYKDFTKWYTQKAG